MFDHSICVINWNLINVVIVVIMIK